MDDEKRATLDLIVDVARTLGVRETGYHLIWVAKDFVEDDDLTQARNVLAQIPPEYYERDIHEHVRESEWFAKAVALLMETFGMDLTLVRPKGSS